MTPARQALWLIALLALISGCSTYRPVGPPIRPENPLEPAEPARGVSVGQHVEIVTKAGGTSRGRVVRVDEEQIELGIATRLKKSSTADGNPGFVRSFATFDRENIESLKIRKFSGWKTAGMVTLVLAAIMGIYLATWEMDFGNASWTEPSSP